MLEGRQVLRKLCMMFRMHLIAGVAHAEDAEVLPDAIDAVTEAAAKTPQELLVTGGFTVLVGLLAVVTLGVSGSWQCTISICSQ